MRKTSYASQKEISASFGSEQKPFAICQTCFRPIYDEYIVQCTRCHGFIQCLECFSEGAEKGCHIREHPFIVVRTQLPEIFSKGWAGNEEMKLLRAIEESGLGNWRDIAVDMNTKTPEECENHFFSTYHSALNAPVPEQKVKEDPPTPAPWPDEDAKPVESHPSDGAEIIMRQKGHYDKVTPAEYNGYMPRRGEFETELYDNAEELINGINFDEMLTKEYSSPQELEDEFQIHINHLQAYNTIIEEREYRHEILKDYGLLEGPFKGFRKNPTAAEQEQEQTLLTLAPFVKFQNLQKITELVDKKDQLQQIIHEKEYWQQIGIDNESQGKAFDQLTETFQRSRQITEQHVKTWNSLVDSLTTCGDTQLEYFKMLNSDEADICNKFNMHPKTYLNIKDLLLREFDARSELSLQDAINFIPDQAELVTSIYNYMKTAGWLQ